MHPRNIYKTPPDFSKLVVKYPEFSKIASIDLNGTVRINFKDLNSLQTLTKCLLHSDFSLSVDFPNDKLVPTVPLRLNYLLWIEDLLNFFNIKENIKGVDIGTGASCIYPLLGAKKFKWNMLGTEIDDDSIKYATKNIKENQLEDHITIRKTSADGNLLIGCLNDDFNYTDFCMCNPPFFSSMEEVNQAKNLFRSPSHNAHSGSFKEIITPGGEIGFVSKLIKESLELRNSIRIYTTMLGHKSSLKILCKIIDELGITQFSHTTFSQGKTTRWGLAWSFTENLNSFKEMQPKKKKKAKPISFVIPQIDASTYTVISVTKKVLEILDVLKIKYNVVEKCESICTMEIIATTNTWSHQRRKRRHNKSIEIAAVPTEFDSNTPNPNDASTSESLHNESISKKRRFNISHDDNEVLPVAESHFTHDIDQTTIVEPHKEVIKINAYEQTTNFAYDNQSVYLKAALCLRLYDGVILLEIAYMSGQSGKDGVNQIVQFVKNNWK